MLIILLTIVVAMTACGATGPAGLPQGQAGRQLRNLQVEPSPRLGVAFPGGDPKYFDLVSKGGMGVARLTAPWSKLEPKPGKFDWRPLDARIARLQELGIEPFVTMDTDAPWAVEPTRKKARNRPPRVMATWTKFVTSLVERYDADGKGDAPGVRRPVRYYQAVNEWLSENNRSGGWTGTTDQLIALVNATHDAVKAADPRASFVMGGIAAMNLDLMALREGLGTYTVKYSQNESSGFTLTPEDARDPKFDVVKDAYRVMRDCRYDFGDAHLYGPVEFNDARLQLFGLKWPQRPLLSSEFGGPSRDYDADITAEDHFRAVIEHNLYVLAKGLRFGLWFRLGEDPSGSTWGNAEVPLFDRSVRPKAGYWAYILLAALLEEVESVEQVDPGAYLLNRPSRPPVLVAWRTEARAVLPLPPEVAAERILRVTEAKRGTYEFEPVPAGGTLSLGVLPLVAGRDLPGGS